MIRRFIPRRIPLKRVILGSLLISTTLLTLFLLHYNYSSEIVAFLKEDEPVIEPYVDTSVSSYQLGLYGADSGKGNDILLTLVRNSELEAMLPTIQKFEEKFNSKYHYDWYFMNDEEFNDDFKKNVTTLVSGRVKFITIPSEFWSYPDHIDQEKAAECRKSYVEEAVNYGGSESYRFMCRFNSGFFYKLPELKDIDYYWRIEPSVDFACDITYDVFQYMRDNNKLYAFNMALGEDVRTIPTLWNTTKDFFNEYPQYLKKENDLRFVSDDMGATYNNCHFWSNFEIASLDFFRSEEYNAFFDSLEEKGGFFYERWGDAPVHTLAVSLMLSPDQVHFVANTGYYHKPNRDCPLETELRDKLHCDCSPAKDFTWHQWSCVSKFFDVNDYIRPDSLKNLKKGYPSIFDTLS